MDLAERIAQADACLADAFSVEGRTVLLAFSGGKESLALLDLCKPYAGRFKLLWINTGVMFPHVEASIRTLGEQYGLVEVKTPPERDIPTIWGVEGLPSPLFAVEDVLPIGPRIGIQLMPWTRCCAVARGEPTARFLAEQSRPTLVLHGQRADDGVPQNGLDGLPRPEHVEVASPLRDWTQDDVLAFAREREIALPPQYPEVMDSLDCWVCPANWLLPGKGAYPQWMEREHPDLAAIVRPGVERILHTLQARVTAHVEHVGMGRA